MNRPTLRSYLAEGGRLEDLPLINVLAESIVLERRQWRPDRRKEAARSCRALADSLQEPGHEQLATVLLWAAEAYEDDEVAELFERALPDEVLGEVLVSRQSRTHPHRLLVREVDRYTCGACGDRYKQTIGVVVDGTGGIAYCPSCISLAAAAVHNTWAEARGGLSAFPTPAVADDAPRPRVKARLALVGAAAAVVGAVTLAWTGVVSETRMQPVSHNTRTELGTEVLGCLQEQERRALQQSPAKVHDLNLGRHTYHQCLANPRPGTAGEPGAATSAD